jgi:hypothetical protein
MSDSFVRELTFIVSMVLSARTSELDFPRRPAKGWLRDAASHERVTAVLKRNDFD